MKNQLKEGFGQPKDREDLQKAFVEDQHQIERYVKGLVHRVDEDSLSL